MQPRPRQTSAFMNHVEGVPINLYIIMASGVEEVSKDEEQVVTPWVAHAGGGQATIDYQKLISE